MLLKEYKRKRNFQVTPEPRAQTAKRKGKSFVIQKHEATRLHYDLRLEMDGKLKSWACPKGLPTVHGEKHLAIQVEDHPLKYGGFEGVIPEGQYGAGTVMVWDRGWYEPLTSLKDPGKLHFVLHGEKLNGEWYLVRFKREENQWLIIKGGASLRSIGKKRDNLSVLSGRTMQQISHSEQVGRPADCTRASPRLKTPSKRAPLPAFIQPMRARLRTHPPAGDWAYEIKFDGWRALILKGKTEVHLVSRNENDLSKKFPEIVEGAKRIKVQDAVIDGEIVALNPSGVSSFQLLQAYDMGQTRPPIYYYAFDLLWLNSKDLRKRPIEERRKLLQSLNFPDVIRFSGSLGSDAKLLLKKVRRLGMEGLMGKRAGSCYESGTRSEAWVKLKLLNEQEFVIGGYTDPGGTRPFFGSLLLGYYKDKELIFAGKVGTGFDVGLLRLLYRQLQGIEQKQCPFDHWEGSHGNKHPSLWREKKKSVCHWVEPVLVCQVKFSEWTNDRQLRQPVFLGLRKDKDATEVTAD